jgi:5-methylcytosine-specific restriction endonuclease McrA
MQSRLAEKKWKTGAREGKVRREKRDLPYSLDQFRAWLRCTIEDQPRCEYCHEPIDIMSISPDHAIPLTRDGSLELANLRGACGSCNTLKGSLLPGEFRALLAGLKSFTEAGRADVLRRLRGAVVHFHSKTKTPAAKQAAPAHRDSTKAVLAFPPMRR